MSKSPRQNKADQVAPEPRGARRRRRTRQSLLDAALTLMAKKGLEGVAINEITEQADVGFGSFYNHFPSKEAIYEALCDEVFERFADAIDAQLATLDDPAEKVSVALRHTMERARLHPDWAKFLIREGFSERAVSGGLSLRLIRDLDSGIHSGRFRERDLLMQFLCIAGTTLSAMSIQQHLTRPNSPHSLLVQARQMPTDRLGERLAETVLISLGIDAAEAAEIAGRPLPAVILHSTDEV
jgi:AcrR family transcriptional regulator